MKSRQSKSPSKLPETIFALGLILLIAGLFNYFFPSSSGAKPPVLTSNTQRNIAIEEARQAGKKTYQFETNFIPGIGNITDPEAYKKQFEEQAKEQVEGQTEE